jgi:hypothetical protein
MEKIIRCEESDHEILISNFSSSHLSSRNARIAPRLLSSLTEHLRARSTAGRMPPKGSKRKNATEDAELEAKLAEIDLMGAPRLRPLGLRRFADDFSPIK